MKNFQKLKDLVTSVEADADKFYNKGNSAAGTRLRIALQQVKVTATEIRKEVSELKNKAK